MQMPIPAGLRGRPFTIKEALALGLTPRMLQNRRFRRLFPHVYCCADLILDDATWAFAALLSVGPHAAASHESGLAVWGVTIGTRGSVHLCTHRRSPTRIPGIEMHRSFELGTVQNVEGCRVLSPERCLVGASTRRKLVDLVMAGDWLITNGHMTRDSFLTFVTREHFDGVQRARRVAELLEPGAESPRESVVRVILELAGLPRPMCNRSYGDEHEFFARPDMSYPKWKVAIEYDGRQHGLSLNQRVHDVWRREQMERLGWTFIIVTAADLHRPREIVNRVLRALVEHGYTGPRPEFSYEWTRTFERAA